MLGKIGGFLYLRQPFRYSSNTFAEGSFGVGAGILTKHQYTDAVQAFLGGGDITLDESNYKASVSYSADTSSVKFINVVGSQQGAMRLEGVHVGRVFNRSVIPTGQDCFFSTGNMGSSNGVVTPDVPVEFTKPDKEYYPAAEVYVIKILSTGEPGVAKFKYCTYPFNEFSTNGDRISLYRNRRFLYSDFGQLELTDSGSKVLFTAARAYTKSVDGCYGEIRKDNDDTFSFVLSLSKYSINIYTDPTLTILDYSISLTAGGSSLRVEFATFAQGNLYGITSSGSVYEINKADGTCTEITAASQSGSEVAIAADIKQENVYCIVDGNVKVIDPTDNSVSTPANALFRTPDLYNDWFYIFGFDYEGAIWQQDNARESYIKCSGADLTESVTINSRNWYFDDVITPGLILSNCIISFYVGQEHRVYDLDGNRFDDSVTKVYSYDTSSSLPSKSLVKPRGKC